MDGAIDPKQTSEYFQHSLCGGGGVVGAQTEREREIERKRTLYSVYAIARKILFLASSSPQNRPKTLLLLLLSLLLFYIICYLLLSSSSSSPNRALLLLFVYLFSCCFDRKRFLGLFFIIIKSKTSYKRVRRTCPVLRSNDTIRKHTVWQLRVV